MNCDDEYEKKEFKKGTKLPVNLILSEGNKYLRLLKFDKAISSFEKILKQDPNSIQSLLGRAKCYMRLARYKEAANDFQQVMKLNPKCTEAVYLKGVTEYLKGNFEKGFQTYWEGYKRRPSCNRLKQGHQLCEKAIEDNLKGDTQMLLTEKDIKNMNTLLSNKNLSPKDGLDTKGPFSFDLKLLEDILKDKSLASIHSLSTDLYNYLRERQNFWKMQEIRRRMDKSGNVILMTNNFCNLLKVNQLIRDFGLCKMALREGKTRICIKKGNEVLDMLKNISRDFSEKDEIEVDTLHYLAMAHLVEDDFTIALKYCNQQLTAASNCNIPGFKVRAYRDFGEVYQKSEDHDKALHFFQKSLQFVKSVEENAIILYKVSDCHMCLKNLEDAQNSAQKCQQFIGKCHNKKFQFDALLLSAEIAVKGKNMKVAEGFYKQALEVADQNNDARRKDLEYLLEIFEEVATKDSYSNERVKIVKITENIKQMSP